MTKKTKISVVLFNLGGPDSLDHVKPFLFNLFNDEAIINLPFFARIPLAFLISRLRNKKAQKIYQQLGGKSPLLEYTLQQKELLQKQLDGENLSSITFSTHVCMRYWHPLSSEIIIELENEQPDHIVFLPLYPQFSTTTTNSSFKDLKDQLNKNPLLKKIPFYTICSYQKHPDFIQAHVILIEDTLKKLSPLEQKNTILLFSAHGIPLDRIEQGDPYQQHVEESVHYIMESFKNFEHIICYQSKVGPKKWLSPDTENIIIQQSQNKKNIVVIPIAFVSEHSETLVELDIDYKNVALQEGAASYHRVPSLNMNSLFIQCLKNLVLEEIHHFSNHQNLKVICA